VLTATLTVPKQLELLQRGLIDACLRQFKYPLSIDEDCDPQQSMISPILAINILGNALAVGTSAHDRSFLVLTNTSIPRSCFNGRQQQQQQQRRALATLVYQVVPEAVLSFLYQVTPTGVW
jgi:hypothetical protein